jgi:hypothetical protein
MPTKLVYVEEFASHAETMKREKTRNVRPSPVEELIKCQINPKQKNSERVDLRRFALVDYLLLPFFRSFIVNIVP